VTLVPRLAGLVVAALAATAGLVGLSTSPASAAACSGSGVSALVDFNDGAGGGVSAQCDPAGSSHTAFEIFKSAGFDQTRNPDGSICKVDGKPAGAQCGRLGNQYWGLYWSETATGKWIYAQSGADALDGIPDGGRVAWVWQGACGARQPQQVKTCSPTKTATPKPTKKPQPTKKPRATKTATAAKPSASATALSSAQASVTPQATPTPTPSASAPVVPSVSATPSASPSESESADGDTGTTTSAQDVDNDFTPAAEHSDLPVWVPFAVILGLAGAAGGTVWWRRRPGSP
jgi:hypothetical protein